MISRNLGMGRRMVPEEPMKERLECAAGIRVEWIAKDEDWVGSGPMKRKQGEQGGM